MADGDRTKAPEYSADEVQAFGARIVDATSDLAAVRWATDYAIGADHESSGYALQLALKALHSAGVALERLASEMGALANGEFDPTVCQAPPDDEFRRFVRRAVE